ncbi:ABC transporter permease [Psychrobacillus sp. INOP01]|uniref:ABC transporter permease n=1 Tax=Psychrobacillus sp. INOP01 TaxID=2829187 RepID=UPI001BA6CFCE|nr:ABC transporter permease [Psychrobacillus sp. INOP01]QUG43643.1 ABC transporter permease [Psychrobacillus sp. INOP01]
MWSYFKWEFRQFFTNKKNIAVYVILLFLALYFALKVAPAYDPIEKVDVAEMEARFNTRDDFIKSVEGKFNIHPSVAYALAIFPRWNELDKARIEALSENDYLKYAEATAEWYKYSDAMTLNSSELFYNPLYYTYDNDYAHADGHYGYGYTASRFTGYIEGSSELSMELFEERTALQTLQRMLNEYLPLVLFISCIFLSVDIVLKDRRNPSLLKGFPIADWKKLFMKGIVAFIGSILTIIPLCVGLVIIGLQNGFGNLSLRVPIYSYIEETFSNMTMGTFILKNGLFISVWILFFITIILFVSIILKAEFANLFVSFIVIAAEWIYFERVMGAYTDIQRYPTSYVQVGQVISGYRNFIYESPYLTYQNGLIILGSCTLILMILTLIASKLKRFKLIA